MAMPADRLTGDDIRRIRKERGWTQEQLGELLGFHAHAARRVSQLECGHKPCGPGMSARIREALRGETT
jgi:transcriptional regulator with XRE-family HTH domain